MDTAENRRKWTAALRSGRFLQSHGYLHNALGYCCLGVACKVYMEAGNALDTKADSEGCTLYNQRRDFLPQVVADWLGLTNRAGVFFSSSDQGYKTLVILNDLDNFTFNQIADIIDQEPPELIIGEDRK